MRISDWSSDVCSSDLANRRVYFDWHPVLHLSEDQVFATIEAGGQKPHWAYAAGARRLSCLICIFSSEDDIRAAVSSSEKGARYARRVMAIEEKNDHKILTLRSRGTDQPPEKRWSKNIVKERKSVEKGQEGEVRDKYGGRWT